MASKSVISLKVDMAVGGQQAVGDLTLSLGDLKKAVESAQVATSKGGKMIEASFMSLSGCITGLNNLSSTLGTLSENYRSFDSAMRTANTMAGKGAAEFAKMKDQVAELSKTIPLAREELAQGLYQVISNGVPEDNWLTFLEQSAKSAVGGVANLEEVVKVTSTIIKNYGMSWEDAIAIQDKIQLTAKNGVTSFEQLATALPSVTGQAAQLGVTLDEMLAVMSTLTGVTGNTSEVSTQLASVLTALTKESSKSQKMADAMGISFNAASVKACGGLQNFLKELDQTVTAYSQKTGELKESIYSKLFGRAEALRMVNALTGQLAQKFDENMVAMADSAGTMEAAVSERLGAADSKAQLLSNRFAEITDNIAQVTEKVRPLITPLVLLGQLSTGFIVLAKSVSAVTSSIVALGSRIPVAGAAFRAFSVQAVAAQGSTVKWASALNMSTTAAARLRVALRGLFSVGLIGAIMEVYGAIMKAMDAAEERMERVRKQAEAFDEWKKSLGDLKQLAADYAAEELTNLQLLYEKATDEAASREERVAAAQRLIQLYPAYFGQMTTEMIMVGKAAGKYEELAASINKAAEARAAFELLVETKKQMLANNEEFVKHKGYAGVFNDRLETDISNLVRQYNIGDIADPKKLAAQLKGKINDYLKKGYTASEAYKNATADLYNSAVNQGYNTNSREFGLVKLWKDVYGSPGKQDSYTDKWAQSAVYHENEMGDRIKKGQELKGRQDRYANIVKNSGYKPGDENKTPDIDITSGLKATGASTGGGTGAKAGKGSTGKASKDKKSGSTAGKEPELTNEQKLAKARALVMKDAETLTRDDLSEALELYDEVLKDSSTSNYQALLPEREDVEKMIFDLFDQYKNKSEMTDTEKLKKARLIMSEGNFSPSKLKEAQTLFEDVQSHADIEFFKDLQTEIDAVTKELEKFEKALEKEVDLDDLSWVKNLEDVEKALDKINEKRATAGAEDLLDLAKKTSKIEELRKGIENLATAYEKYTAAMEENKTITKESVKAMGYDGVKERMKELRELMNDPNLGVEQRKAIGDLVLQYADLLKYTVSLPEQLQNLWSGFKGVVSGVQSLRSAFEDSKTGLDMFINGIDAIIGIVSSISGIVGTVNLLTETLGGGAKEKAIADGIAATAAGTAAASVAKAAAASVAKAAADEAAAAAAVKLAAANIFLQNSLIPGVGVLTGIGQVSAMTAAVVAAGNAVKVPLFANGGVVFGPTLGVMGEYPGASHNPEVIAPLDRLRSMIEQDGSGKVKFTIEGRTLVGVLEKELKHLRRI